MVVKGFVPSLLLKLIIIKEPSTHILWFLRYREDCLWCVGVCMFCGVSKLTLLRNILSRFSHRNIWHISNSSSFICGLKCFLWRNFKSAFWAGCFMNSCHALRFTFKYTFEGQKYKSHLLCHCSLSSHGSLYASYYVKQNALFKCGNVSLKVSTKQPANQLSNFLGWILTWIISPEPWNRPAAGALEICDLPETAGITTEKLVSWCFWILSRKRKILPLC